eukprot:SAG22_NODE_356_length_11774_cov_17.345353_4_plen_160_part_00
MMSPDFIWFHPGFVSSTTRACSTTCTRAAPHARAAPHEQHLTAWPRRPGDGAAGEEIQGLRRAGRHADAGLARNHINALEVWGVLLKYQSINYFKIYNIGDHDLHAKLNLKEEHANSSNSVMSNTSNIPAAIQPYMYRAAAAWPASWRPGVVPRHSSST